MENNNGKENFKNPFQSWLSITQKHELTNEAKALVIDEVLKECCVSSVNCLEADEVPEYYDTSFEQVTSFTTVDRDYRTGAPVGIIEPLPSDSDSHTTPPLDFTRDWSFWQSTISSFSSRQILSYWIVVSTVLISWCSIFRRNGGRCTKKDVKSEKQQCREYLTCAPGLSRGRNFNNSESELSSEEESGDDEGKVTIVKSDEQAVLLNEYPANEKKTESTVNEDKRENEKEETVKETKAQKNEAPIVTDNHLHNDEALNELYKDRAYYYASWTESEESLAAFELLRPRMAKTFPFELDLFQKQAILCLESGESVFVAAHTSAGKTVVADYAVALAHLNMTRVIYTSPIKALSNQKYRDFKRDYDNVGIVTGDVQMNPDAFCIVMTTEILRSMLYNGSEVLRELEWVIFDEVHYVNNPERGVVWEEVIIMLPKHVKLILLSATVSDVMEFAEWIGRIKQRKIFVVKTSSRPVPLEHHLYLGDIGTTKNVQIQIVDKNGCGLLCNGFMMMRFSFDHAVRQKENSKAATSYKNIYKPYTGSGAAEKNLWLSLIQHLKEKSLLPMVIFVFSRKVCDTLALMLLKSSLDLTTSSEKRIIRKFFKKSISKLSANNKALRQVTQLQKMCQIGIAVHHSGVLPLMKEIVEMLFQEGRVRVLFATETFSMGINMPAKTVVFNSIDKHDGRTVRLLNPGEYTQMAGRAGRRGLDSSGTVILLCRDKIPHVSDLRTMILGSSPRIESQFRVTFTMILNLLRCQPLSPEMMLMRSFVENLSFRDIMVLNKNIETLMAEQNESQFANCVLCSQGNIQKFYRVAEECYEVARCIIWNVTKLIEPGMVIVVQLLDKWLLGLVLKKHFYKNEWIFEVFVPYRNLKPKNDKLTPDERCNQFLFYSTQLECNLVEPDFRYYSILEFSLSSIVHLSNASFSVSNHQIFDDWGLSQNKHNECENDAILTLIRNLYGVYEYYKSNGTRMRVPLEWCSLRNARLDITYLNRLRSSAVKFRCFCCDKFREHFYELYQIEEKQAEVDDMKRKVDCFKLRLGPSYEKKRAVLRMMKYIDYGDVIQFPGRIACAINQNPLLYSQLLLNNKFADVTPDEVAAILSASACQYKCKFIAFREPRLQELMNMVCDMDRRIRLVRERCDDVDDDIDDQLNFGLMEVIQKWSLGVPFGELLKITDAQEGAIVRCIQRVCELCRDLKTASSLMGNSTLTTLLEDTMNSLKRDITVQRFFLLCVLTFVTIPEEEKLACNCYLQKYQERNNIEMFPFSR
ncbi:Helicase SKI2W [Trichinella sp. T6]|nr:Helicase SKI2W [Trichinella sp. T6]